MKTQWNLKQFYSSRTDPQIEKDLKKAESLFTWFAKKYKNKTDYLKKEQALKTALADYEKLSADPSGSRAILYFHFSKDLNSTDTETEAALNRISERLTKAANEVLFFELNLGKLPKAKQKEFLKAKQLAPYRYQLERIFETSKHDLSEAEEKILSRKALPARSMWVDGVERVVSNLTIPFEKKELPLAEAIGRVPLLPTRRRRALWDSITGALQTAGDFAESEINAVYTDKKINDELRGFKEPYSATVLSFENDEESVCNLVDTVTDASRISHRFYKAKQKLLGLEKMQYADRNAVLQKQTPTIPFKQAAQELTEVFGSIHPTYAEIFTRLVDRGQVDVFPKKGKTGGAYCLSEVHMPTFVLLNHVDDLGSFMTLAHEMGHAVHGERSKEQPPRYQGHSITTAETASTLFEGLTFAHLFKKLSEREKIVALHNKVQDDIATVFRQIACFTFELEMHRQIREKGAISKHDMASLHNKHMKHYLGPAFSLTESDGYFFVYWSHIRRPFYVYSYAYGQLVSNAMVSRFKQDPKYAEDIDQFLTAGASKKPEDIYADIGIDTRDPNFFKEGLKEIEKNVKELEKRVAGRV